MWQNNMSLSYIAYFYISLSEQEELKATNPPSVYPKPM